MSSIIDHIEEICAEETNAPGVETFIDLVSMCGVEAIPAVADYDPATMTDDKAYTITDNVTLKPNYLYARWHFRKTDSSYKVEEVGEEDAKTYNLTINFYIPKLRPALARIMNAAKNAQFHVMCKDRNNSDPRACGEKGNGCYVKVTEQTNPKNGYVLEITATNLDNLPPYYQGAIPLLP